MELKLCIHCQHFLPMNNRDLCGHPQSADRADPDFLVRGIGSEHAPYYASAMRAGICGKDAALFQPKEA